MGNLTVALAQINVTVGALRENAEKIIDYASQAARQGAALVVFPELALSGYPPEDLVLRTYFVDDCNAALHEIAQQLPAQLTCIVGTPSRSGEKIQNSAAVITNREVRGFYHKMLLPNYGVFDEQRVFLAGHAPTILVIGTHRLAIHICEDSWHPKSAPTMLLKNCGIDALVNISASPYQHGKLKIREQILGETAEVVGARLLYCNLVGGQDELVFDGASMAMSDRNTVVARGASFKEGLVFVELPSSKSDSKFFDSPNTLTQAVQVLRIHQPESVAPPLNRSTMVVATPLDDLAEVYAALVTGLRDYTDKNGFKKAVVAVSGGIDSALVLTIAVDALGNDRVAGITMPSLYSSHGTLSDAKKLGENLNVAFYTLPISKLFQSYLDELSAFWDTGQGGVAEENLQARIRGNLIMAFSNKMGWLVLTAGNKSEHATGYATLYGDMCGGFAVIKDVPKTLVFELVRWRNSQSDRPVIPPSSIERAPSAELRPEQRDTDTLPPYETLDAILEAYVENDLSAREIVASGFDPATVSRVIRLVDLSEYKRRQGPPGIKITQRAFGRDRRVPITNAYKAHEWMSPAPADISAAECLT